MHCIYCGVAVSQETDPRQCTEEEWYAELELHQPDCPWVRKMGLGMETVPEKYKDAPRSEAGLPRQGQRQSVAYLSHLTSYVPDGVLTNEWFEQRMATTDKWIRERTGVVTRHFMDDYSGMLLVEEMTLRAVRRFQERHPDSLNDIDLILSAGSILDRQYPIPATRVTELLGRDIPSFHLINACSSVLSAIHVAAGLVRSGAHRKILVTSAEPFTTQVDYEDRNNSILFGDASACFLVQAEPGEFALVRTATSSRYSDVIQNLMPRPPVINPLERDPQYGIGLFGQSGAEVAGWIFADVVPNIRAFIRDSGLELSDIDHFIPHQANQRISESIFKQLDLPNAEHHHVVEKYGNTSSVGWVVALAEAAERMKGNDNVLVAIFGGGLSWGQLWLKRLAR